jgi:hypothetical protein
VNLQEGVVACDAGPQATGKGEMELVSNAALIPFSLKTIDVNRRSTFLSVAATTVIDGANEELSMHLDDTEVFSASMDFDRRQLPSLGADQR